MRPARTSSRLGLPRIQSAGSFLALALVAGSVLFALLNHAGIGALLLLIPSSVLSGWVWQILSYAFIATDPLGVIFGALILFQTGGALESFWGVRRMLSFALGTTVLAAAVTVLLSLAFPAIRSYPYAGGWVLAGVVWVGYGLAIGRGQANFWGLPVTGNVLALIGAGFVLLTALFGSPLAVIPELLGMAFAWAYMRGASPRVALLRLQSWRLQGKLKSRSKHLKLVGKDRNMPGDSDRFLH